MFSFQGACLSFFFKRLNETSNSCGISVNLLWEVVGQNGLEPSTSRLSVVCSSQLSYWPISAHFFWWRLAGSNRWPPACKAGALPIELHPHCLSLFRLGFLKVLSHLQNRIVCFVLPWHSLALYLILRSFFLESCASLFSYSLERRWSSRTFRYGYLVTTSPQSLV